MLLDADDNAVAAVVDDDDDETAAAAAAAVEAAVVDDDFVGWGLDARPLDAPTGADVDNCLEDLQKKCIEIKLDIYNLHFKSFELRVKF